MAEMSDRAWITVTLREWLENQRLERSPHRAELIAAFDRGETVAIRALLADAPFSNEQRRYIEDLLERWERAASDGEDPTASPHP